MSCEKEPSSWEAPVTCTSISIGLQEHNIYSVIDLGVDTSESLLEEAAVKIGLGIHKAYIGFRMNLLSRMSGHCRKITRGRQSRENLVQTHEERTYALTYALIRLTAYFIARLVLLKQTVKPPSGLPKCKGVSVIFIELTSRYECGSSDKTKGPWAVKVNQFMLLGVSLCAHATLKNDQGNLNNNPKWSNQVRESKHAEHIIHGFLVLSWAHNADGCLNLLWPSGDC